MGYPTIYTIGWLIVIFTYFHQAAPITWIELFGAAGFAVDSRTSGTSEGLMLSPGLPLCFRGCIRAEFLAVHRQFIQTLSIVYLFSGPKMTNPTFCIDFELAAKAKLGFLYLAMIRMQRVRHSAFKLPVSKIQTIAMLPSTYNHWCVVWVVIKRGVTQPKFQ